MSFVSTVVATSQDFTDQPFSVLFGDQLVPVVLLSSQ